MDIITRPLHVSTLSAAWITRPLHISTLVSAVALVSLPCRSQSCLSALSISLLISVEHSHQSCTVEHDQLHLIVFQAPKARSTPLQQFTTRLLHHLWPQLASICCTLTHEDPRPAHTFVWEGSADVDPWKGRAVLIHEILKIPNRIFLCCCGGHHMDVHAQTPCQSDPSVQGCKFLVLHVAFICHDI
jgi:hypothetical protein